jgi:hypothetical protein
MTTLDGIALMAADFSLTIPRRTLFNRRRFPATLPAC